MGVSYVFIDAVVWQGSKSERFDLFYLTQIDLLTGLHLILHLQARKRLSDKWYLYVGQDYKQEKLVIYLSNLHLGFSRTPEILFRK